MIEKVFIFTYAVVEPRRIYYSNHVDVLLRCNPNQRGFIAHPEVKEQLLKDGTCYTEIPIRNVDYEMLKEVVLTEPCYELEMGESTNESGTEGVTLKPYIPTGEEDNE